MMLGLYKFVALFGFATGCVGVLSQDWKMAATGYGAMIFMMLNAIQETVAKSRP